MGNSENSPSGTEQHTDLATPLPEIPPEPHGNGEFVQREWNNDFNRVERTLERMDFRDADSVTGIFLMAREAGLIPCETDSGVRHALSPNGVKILVDAAIYDEEHRLLAFDSLPEVAHLPEAVLQLPQAEPLREDLGLETEPTPAARVMKIAKKPTQILATWANRRAA